jgi:hypothetical protein
MVKKNPQGRKPGATVKKLTDVDKFNGRRKTNSAPEGEWKVVGGIRRLVPKKK